MTLAKYNTKKGSPNIRRKRRFEELEIKTDVYSESNPQKLVEEEAYEEDSEADLNNE